MAKKLYEESSIRAIADAIRSKTGTTNSYKVSEMAAAIATIQGDGNGGDYDITVTKNNDGTQSLAITDANNEPTVLISKTITTNGTYNASQDNADGYVSVTVNVPTNGFSPTGTIEITDNGTYDVANYASAEVNIVGSGSGGLWDDDTLAKFITRDKTLTTVTIPSGLTNIGDHAFGGMQYMTSINLPDTITKIGQYAFQNCNGLILTSLPNGITSIGNNAFQYCYNAVLTELPAGLTKIDMYTFHSCRNLALTSLPSGLTRIEDYAFYDCPDMTISELPDGLTSLGGNCFSRCTGLTISEIPASVTSIGNNAFNGCTGLTQITFKGKPTTLNYYAFRSCDNITDIYVPWAEGEVSSAPWGATNATVHYNHTT